MSILVVTELHGGEWHKMSWEALAAGQQAGAGTGKTLAAVVLGSGLEAAAAEVAGVKADKVYAIDHALLKNYTPDGYVIALKQLIEATNPYLVLFPHTYQVRDYGPKLATRLERAFVSDAVALRAEDGGLVLVRQLMQGKLNADVAVTGEPPYVASIQSGAFRADALERGSAPAPVESFAVEIAESDLRTKPHEWFREAKAEVDLSAAERIVSVGRGIKEADNIALAQELAKALGAEVAASRPICDNGWLPLERQVGSSGQTVSPKLYLALGISGAIQHVVGMKGSRTIVAINKDASAPIFEIADYGIVGDIFEVVPAMIEKLKESAG